MSVELSGDIQSATAPVGVNSNLERTLCSFTSTIAAEAVLQEATEASDECRKPDAEGRRLSSLKNLGRV